MASRLPEQRLWDLVRGAMGGAWHATRIENRLSSGVPDVHFATQQNTTRDRLTGWIELKVAKKPARATTPVKIPHLTNEQVNWHLEHRAHGGQSWLLIEMGEFLYLFPGWRAPDIQGGLNLAQWALMAKYTPKSHLRQPIDFLEMLVSCR